MKRLIFIAVILIGLVVYYLIRLNHPKPTPTDNSRTPTQSIGSNNPEIIAKNLDTPWALAFLPDGNLLVTERGGGLLLINSKTLEKTLITKISGVAEISEGGLLGIALHPDFSNNHYLYLYYTYSADAARTLNRVVRYRFDGKNLADEKIIIDEIPGAPNHNGGRLKFGPDGFLYITTGDAQNPSLAQKTDSLAGKILRATDEGQPAPGNPFNNLVYSYGHRNPQGLAWDNVGRLWATEHGPSAQDELNLIEIGKNYGWPTITGTQSQTNMVTPVIQSGNTTWAPAGMAFLNGSLFFGGLRGQTLFEAVIRNDNQISLTEHFKGEFGRIRDVVVGPDNALYFTTSNHDGRGSPASDDDRIIKVTF